MGKPNRVENLPKALSPLVLRLWKTCRKNVEKFSLNSFNWTPPFENKSQPVFYIPGLDDAFHCCRNQNIYLIH